MAAPSAPGWQGRMATARFGGLAFLTDSHEAKFGRRLVVHEFPGAEAPLVEDLGGAAPSYRVNAYFLGWDYDRARDEFLALLSMVGADWLNHPWLGYVWVRPHSWSVHESNDKGGLATITIEFAPGGVGDTTPVTDAVDRAYAAVQTFRRGVMADYQPQAMAAAGLTSFLAAVHGRLEKLRDVIALGSLPLAWGQQIVGLIAGVNTDLATLSALPGAYGAALGTLADALGAGSPDLREADVPRVVMRLTRSPGAMEAKPADPVARANLVSESALRERLLVSAACEIALFDFTAAGYRDSALGAALAGLDGILPGASDPVFQAALDARAALFSALMAQDLRPQAVRDLVSPLPAVVLAHRLGVSEAVFLARNPVRHPLFVVGRVYG